MKILTQTEAIKISEKFRLTREKRGEPLSGGVVLIWKSTAYGWKNKLRDPDHERPGAIAINEAGEMWLATGGDEQDGANTWEPVKNPFQGQYGQAQGVEDRLRSIANFDESQCIAALIVVPRLQKTVEKRLFAKLNRLRKQ